MDVNNELKLSLNKVAESTVQCWRIYFNVFFIFSSPLDSYFWDKEPSRACWAPACRLWESKQRVRSPAGVPPQCFAWPVGSAAAAGPRGAAGARGNRRGWRGDLSLTQKARSAAATRAGALHVSCRPVAGLPAFAVSDSQWPSTVRCDCWSTASLPPGLPAAEPEQRARWLPQWAGGPAVLLAGRWNPGVRPTSGPGPLTDSAHAQTAGKCCCRTGGTCVCQVRPYFVFAF